ncbi:MAG: hypothetical protein CHACPFDD_03601 [Phycisphaerae bacterium]|nr:hypothetical protein [Phycisphaerae bacterium]
MSRIVPLMVLAGLVIALGALLHRQQEALVSGRVIADQVTPTGRLRPIAEVVSAVKAMDLVTTRIQTRVHKSIESDVWRGRTYADVAAPVTYLYGVDLANLRAEDVQFGPLTRTYVLRVPAPRRLAVEVDMNQRAENVSVSGLRLRSRSGEYYLGLSRVGLYEEARQTVLPGETLERIRDESGERLRELVQNIVGPDARVEVVFDEGLP